MWYCAAHAVLRLGRERLRPAHVHRSLHTVVLELRRIVHAVPGGRGLGWREAKFVDRRLCEWNAKVLSHVAAHAPLDRAELRDDVRCGAILRHRECRGQQEEHEMSQHGQRPGAGGTRKQPSSWRELLCFLFSRR